MMSSEEDLDVSALREEDKGKSSSAKTTKRVRQRVDAGEPRNSYASIPNFSSRPGGGLAFAGGGSSNGFNASKMLCDLIGSGGLRPKEEMQLLESAAAAAERNGGAASRMFAMNGAGELLFGSRGIESPERCSSAESSSSHLLRDILQQGRGGGGGGPSGGHAPKSPQQRQRQHPDEDSNESDESCRMSAAVRPTTANADERAPDSPGSSTRGSDSPPLDTLWQSSSEANALPPSAATAPAPSSTADVKRARVETIVNNMLQGPCRNSGAAQGLEGTQGPVNGCKKRKLYQPQQHETSSKNAVNGDSSELYEEEDDFSDHASSPVSKRRNTANPDNNPELFSFKQQIRQVQQQLVALQQQYMEMVVGDSTDDEVPRVNSTTTHNHHLANERPRSADLSDCEDMKPRLLDPKPEITSRTHPGSNNNNNNNNNNNHHHPHHHSNNNNHHHHHHHSKPFVDYDNTSLYDEQRRLVIDDGKDASPPSGAVTKPDLQELRQSCIVQPCHNLDYEWLAESLKAELSTSLSQVVDAVVSRCVQRKASSSSSVMASSKTLSPPEPSDPPSKDPTLLSQMLDRKSPRTGKVIDRGTRVNGHGLCGLRTSPYPPDIGTAPKPSSFFFPLKPATSVAAATAAFLYGSPPQLPQSYSSPTAHSTPTPQDAPEQTEAMSLVVTPKKKRHKVTDTRLHQRGPLCGGRDDVSPKYSSALLDPLPPVYHHHPPPPLVPVSLPTTVAIPNPSLNQSELFHSFPYERLSQHFGAPPPMEPPQDDDNGPPPTLQLGSLHPMLSFHHHPRGSPDSLHLSHHLKQQSNDNGDISDAGDSPAAYDSSGMTLTSTLTPMHLRKAKLMFFYARYPSSAVLKMYFPDIKFNKNNTAQLVKWFSNFREFFYIQMEKYARQAMSEGIKATEDLKVNSDSELLRVLNLHYNRNNHIEAPENFRYVVEQTLREFFKALIAGKDTEQSWKKSIYKVIARLDDNVPEYFKNPNFLESLE